MDNKNSEITEEWGPYGDGAVLRSAVAAYETEQLDIMIRTSALDLAIKAAEPMHHTTEPESVHKDRIIELAKLFEARLRGTDA